MEHQRSSFSRNVICTKCKGKGSKFGASMKCTGCQGSGMKVFIRQLGPSIIQQMQHPCNKFLANSLDFFDPYMSLLKIGVVMALVGFPSESKCTLEAFVMVMSHKDHEFKKMK